MKEVFKERADNRIEFFIVFGLISFMWLLTDVPWLTPIIIALIYLWFGSKNYFLVFKDEIIEIVYPWMKWKNQEIKLNEVENIYHLILFQTKRRSDLIRVNTNSNEYKIAIEREPEDFRKINTLIHHKNWGSLMKTKGDATNIKEVIRRREEGWIKK